MNPENKRFGPKNLRIISNEQKAIIYDVPTNSFFKISPNVADELRSFRDNKYDHFEFEMKRKLHNQIETTPRHDFWMSNHHIRKLTFNVTSMCNLRCIYCYAEYGKYCGYEAQIMSPEDASQYINALLSSNLKSIDTVQFFGGEPTLAADTIKSICERFTLLFKEHRLDVLPKFTMITNCTAIDNEMIEIIKCFDIRLVVSIDGPKHINDLQRIFPDGTGTFDIISNNINKLSPYIDGLEATYTKLHQSNNLSIDDVITFLHKTFSVPKMNIVVVPVEGCENLEINRDYSPVASSFSSEDSFLVKAYYSDMQSDLFCEAGFQSIALMPNGDIYPCHMYANESIYCLGNIKNCNWMQTLEGRIEGIPFGSKYERDECCNCWARKICHICPAKMAITKKEESDIINASRCNERKDYISRRLLEMIHYER